jgi:hypothetical protein
VLIAILVLGCVLVVTALAIAVHLNRIADVLEAQNKHYGISDDDIAAETAASEKGTIA